MAGTQAQGPAFRKSASRKPSQMAPAVKAMYGQPDGKRVSPPTKVSAKGRVTGSD